jgi:nucleoside-diphosphate-sugar epimerase
MSNKPERFLVTGAGGCIGAWAARCLLDEGAEVIATDLSEDLRRFRLVSHPKAEEKLDFVRLDVTDTKAVTDLVAEREVTHIVHLAGLQVPFCAANPPLGAMVNVVGTVNIFEAARHAGRPVGLVYASSAAVFGSGSFFSSGIVGDTSSLLPENLYGVYKVANEGTARIYALDHGVGSIGLRPFVVYGPGRDQGMTSDPTVAMLAAAAGVPYHIKWGGNALLTYAPDCARMFIASSRAATGSGDPVCCNVPGRRIAIAELINLIEDVVPAAKGLLTFERAPLRVPALLEAPTIESTIGEVPNCSIEEGVRATIKHFESALSAGLLKAPATK